MTYLEGLTQLQPPQRLHRPGEDTKPQVAVDLEHPTTVSICHFIRPLGPYEPACLTATPLALTEQGVAVGVGTADRRESPLQRGKRAREHRIDPSLRLIYDGQGRIGFGTQVTAG